MLTQNIAHPKMTNTSLENPESENLKVILGVCLCTYRYVLLGASRYFEVIIGTLKYFWVLLGTLRHFKVL